MKNWLFVLLLVASGIAVASPDLQPAKLFAKLPDTCPTPDALAVAPDGSLTLSCPNFASKTAPGRLLSLNESGRVSDIGPFSVGGRPARPMGLAYGPDGELYVANNSGSGFGTLVRLTLREQKIADVEVIAKGLHSPNGLRYRDGHLYLTQLVLPRRKGDEVPSGLYRFSVEDRDVAVPGDLSSPHLIFSAITENPDSQFGLDGLVFDDKGDLFVTNFGDALVHRLTLLASGSVSERGVFAQLPIGAGLDGIAIGPDGQFYLAGFAKNQIFALSPSGESRLLAHYPDNRSENGEVDQPADLIVYKKRLIISNFDLMAAPGLVNSGHSKPYTLSVIPL